MSTLVTHQSPDLDAIASCWLLQRYGGLEDCQIAFVNTGSPDPAILAAATAVVDTGREFDPERLRFDHHHLPGAASTATCAARQVFDWLVYDRDASIFYLLPLINLVWRGDTGARLDGADWSRTVGVHALLSAQKARKTDDIVLLAYGYELLDLLAEGLKAHAYARALLGTYVVYRSDDGLLVALNGAPQGATVAAFEAGARLVVFRSAHTLADGSVTHAIGVQRAGEWHEPHCGALVEAIIADPSLPQDMLDELSSWFRHPGGFFSGRGTQKAPRTDPVEVGVREVARALDAAWTREVAL